MVQAAPAPLPATRQTGAASCAVPSIKSFVDKTTSKHNSLLVPDVNLYTQRFSRSEAQLQPCENEFSHHETRFGTLLFRAVFAPSFANCQILLRINALTRKPRLHDLNRERTLRLCF